MPHGPPGTTQQGLQGAKCMRTGSGSIGLRSVNKVHGLASPEHKGISNPTVTHANTNKRTQTSSAHGVSAEMPLRHPDSAHQCPEGAATARFSSWASHSHHPLHNSAAIPHPSAPTMDSQAMGQQQSGQGKQQLHAGKHVSQHPHSHQHPAESQRSQEHATAVNLSKPVKARMPPSRQVERQLSGVRSVNGGWEARLGRQGYTKAKESLGIHATGTLHP